MAVEYSLLTWAGLGTTVTFTDAGDVVNFTAHGAPNGHAFRFATTGSLPTGLTANTTYYLRQGADANKFTIHDTAAHAIAGTNQVTFSGTGSGTNKVIGEYWAALPATDPGNGGNYRARYGAAGSERVYASIYHWHIGRNDQKNLQTELVLEIQGKWEDKIYPSYTAYSVITGFYSVCITTKIHGVRDPDSYHGGRLGGGWVLVAAYSAGTIPLNFSNLSTTVDGVEINVPSSTSVPVNSAVLCNCIVKVPSNISGVVGPCGASAKIYNNIIYGGAVGVLIGSYAVSNGANIYNNLVTGCAKGFSCLISGGFATIVGNVSAGNAVNWDTTYIPANSFMGKNAGVSGDIPWTLAGQSSITTVDTSAHFIDFAGANFNYVLGSPLIDSGSWFFGSMEAVAINNANSPNGDPRPSYKNGEATEWDIGPFEFDHGNGLAPNLQNFTISGLISGSRVKVKKTSDGTVIHNAVVDADSLLISYDAGASDTPVTIDIAKGAAAPYCRRYRTTSNISHLGASGVAVSQIPDIAAGTYAAGVATDWSVNTSTGAITHSSGSTVYTVQDLYSWLCYYYDHADRVDLNMPLYGTTSEIFGLQNGGSISDADIQYLKGGSIQAGTTLWANVYTVGTQAADTPIYLHLDGVPVSSFWPNGNIDILVKVLAGAAGVVDVRAHQYGDFYDHWRMVVGAGRNVAAISTSDDPDNQTAASTVAGYSDITVTIDNPTDRAIDGDDTSGDYTTTINGAGRTVQEIYERLKYLTRGPSVYASANPAFAEVKVAPYGTFAAGVFSGARGVWLENVAASDALNYLLTDNDGVQHQAAVAPVAISAPNLITGTRVQIYNVTTDTEIDNSIVTAPYSIPITVGTDVDLNDIIRMRATYCSGTTAKEEIVSLAVVTSAGCSFIDTQENHAVYNAWGVDGAAVTEYIADYANIQADADDADGQSTKVRFGAWFIANNTTANGIANYFGGIETPATNLIRVKTSVLNLHIQNISATPLIYTDSDVRLYRDDNTPIVAAGVGSIVMDYNGVPDVVETGVSGLTTAESNKLQAIPTNPLISSSILDGDLTTEQALRVMLAALAGKSTPNGSLVNFRDQADSKDRIRAVVDEFGSRDQIILDGT